MITYEKMTKTIIMCPIRYPLKPPSVRTLKRTIDLAEQIGAAQIHILHINILHKGEKVDQVELSKAVTQTVGSLPNADYNIQDGFLLEESILHEAVQLRADYVVIGKSRRSRWRRLLGDRIAGNVDLETFLQNHLDSELVVV